MTATATLPHDRPRSWHEIPIEGVVDTLRARRSGVRFQRTRGRGLFQSTPIPRKHLKLPPWKRK